ncbi:GFA family protein [Aquicoccus sp. SCR17]|nr:GFA family protein [Carideicomes alvinocaridis]
MCGAVRLTLRDMPDHFGVCHCEMCRRWTGVALFAVTVPAGSLDIQGAENIATFQSSAWASRSFCRLCGSNLWYRYDPDGTGGGGYEVPIGLLDDADGLTLEREIFIDGKPDGYALTGDHQRLTRAETLAIYAPDAVPDDGEGAA